MEKVLEEVDIVRARLVAIIKEKYVVKELKTKQLKDDKRTKTKK
jgi:hypothetical protein